jgi:hypothetical protein
MKPTQHDLTPTSGKRTYEKPNLQVYGDLAEITNTVANTGNTYDASQYATRTH